MRTLFTIALFFAASIGVAEASAESPAPNSVAVTCGSIRSLAGLYLGYDNGFCGEAMWDALPEPEDSFPLVVAGREITAYRICFEGSTVYAVLDPSIRGRPNNDGSDTDPDEYVPCEEPEEAVAEIDLMAEPILPQELEKTKRHFIPFKLQESTTAEGCDLVSQIDGQILAAGSACWDDPARRWEMESAGVMMAASSPEALRRCIITADQSDCVQENPDPRRRLSADWGEPYAIMDIHGTIFDVFRGCVKAVDRTSGGVHLVRSIDRLAYAIEIRDYQNLFANATADPLRGSTMSTLEFVDGDAFPLDCNGAPIPNGPAHDL